MRKLVFDRKKRNQKFKDSKMMSNEFKYFVPTTKQHKTFGKLSKSNSAVVGNAS